MLSERDRRLSVLAIDHRYLTRAQLDECSRRTESHGASLDQILLERGYLTPVELAELERLAAAPPRFAEIARERGLASESQVFDALRLKEELAAVDVHRPLGQILVERDVLSETQVDEILEEQTRRGPARRGPFLLGEELGRGTSGVVCRAVHGATGREVALKTVPGAVAALPRLVRAQRVLHPNIARVRDAGTEGDVLWIASDLVEGLPLYDHVVGSMRLPVEEATATMKQIAAALDVIHRAGLAHGQLTPRNVLITEMREVRLTDLALQPGDVASDLRASASLWAFMLEGEHAEPRPRFEGQLRLAAGIHARLLGGAYHAAAELAADLDRLDEELLHKAHREDSDATPVPAPAAVPVPRSRRPRRRRR